MNGPASAAWRPMVFLGVPGAGKGTQAKRIGQRLGIPHISTGDMFREMAKSGSEAGVRVWENMQRGELVPDELVCQVVAERLMQPDCHNGFILDGFPRTLAQAEWLSGFMAGHGVVLPDGMIVVYLTVGYNDLYRRLLGRRTCPLCGRIYNDFTQPPRQAGVCDLDKTPLVQRRDDDPHVIRERLSAYEEQTLPLVEYFRRHARLVTVNGADAPARVSEQIMSALAAPGGGRAPA